MGGRGKISSNTTDSFREFARFAMRDGKQYSPDTEWLENTSWTKNVTNQEREAVTNYQYSGYLDLNEALRTGGSKSDEVIDLESKMNGLMARSKLPESIVLYRGFSSEMGRKLHDMYDKDMLNPGTTISDKGFISSTTDTGIAKDMAETMGNGFNIVMMKIEAPKGLKAINAGLVGENRGENEVILNKNTKFKITKTAFTRGILYVTARASN
jgi:hypothetical protein